MKFTFCSILAVAFLGLASLQVQAQTLPPRRGGAVPKPRTPPAAANGEMTKDGYVMKGGRVIVTEQGLTNPLSQDKKLLNGTTVSPTGLVTSTSGTTTQLAEGDIMSLTGRITPRTEAMAADSLLKIKQYDLKYPGKRKKMEEERLRKDKIAKEKEKEKMKAEQKKAKEKEKESKK
jgi:hypothetical protein